MSAGSASDAGHTTPRQLRVITIVNPVGAVTSGNRTTRLTTTAPVLSRRSTTMRAWPLTSPTSATRTPET